MPTKVVGEPFGRAFRNRLTKRRDRVLLGLLFYVGDFFSGALGITRTVRGSLSIFEWLRDAIDDLGNGKFPANSLDVFDAVLPEESLHDTCDEIYHHNVVLLAEYRR